MLPEVTNAKMLWSRISSEVTASGIVIGSAEREGEGHEITTSDTMKATTRHCAAQWQKTVVEDLDRVEINGRSIRPGFRMESLLRRGLELYDFASAHVAADGRELLESTRRVLRTGLVSGWSMAGLGAGVGERLAGLGDELPVIAAWV